MMLESVWLFYLPYSPKISKIWYKHWIETSGMCHCIEGFLLFIFNVLIGVSQFTLLCQGVNINSQTQFRMSKSWSSLQEQYNLGWIFHVDFKKSFLLHLSSLLLLVGSSYLWKLVPEYNYFQRSLAENTWQTCGPARDSQGWEKTIWSSWLKAHTSELQAYVRTGFLVLFNTVKQYIWLLAPTTLEKSNITRPKLT